MKIKQKGVTTTAIAMIVIIVVAVAGIGAYFLTQEEKKPDEAALGVTTTSLSGGTVDAVYSATLVATGGTSPYTWENIGSLPDGLSLSTGGVISGTPTAEGDFSFTVKVTDSVENTDTKALSIHVAAVAPLGVTTTSLSGGTVDAVYSATLVASGGTSPYTWSIESGSLPDGLSLSTAGAISGTPTAEGDFSFTVKVTDSVENTDTQALSIHVEAAGDGIIASATSLSFKIDYTLAGVGEYTFWGRARNIGTADIDLRWDVTLDTTIVSWIYSGSQQEGWYGAAGYWLSFSSLGYDFSEYWSSAYEDYTTYTGQLVDWISGEWEYTAGGITYRIYDIQVNPTLGDEVFSPS